MCNSLPAVTRTRRIVDGVVRLTDSKVARESGTTKFADRDHEEKTRHVGPYQRLSRPHFAAAHPLSGWKSRAFQPGSFVS